MQNLTEGREAKVLFRYVLPMILGNVVQQLYHTADTIIVGRILGKSALASVGVSSPIMVLMISLLVGAGMGADILSAECTGKRDSEALARVTDTFMSTIVVAAVILGITGFFLAELILAAIHTPQEISEDAAAYLRIIFLGLFLMAGYNTFSGIIRGTGDTVMPLIFLSASVTGNILLDLLFIAVLNWGITGAAYATIFAQGAAFFCWFVYSAQKNARASLRLKGFSFDYELLKRGLHIGLPIAVQHMTMSTGQLMLQSIVNPFGMTTVAAYAAGMKVDSLASLPVLNIAQAASIFTAQNAGAGNKVRVRNGKRAALLIGWTVSIILALSAWLFGEKIIVLFNEDMQVVRLGGLYLRILCPSYLFASAFHVLMGVMRGCGNTLIPMSVSIISLWIVRLPTALFLGRISGIQGVWFSIPVSWGFGAFCMMCIMRSRRWRNYADDVCTAACIKQDNAAKEAELW